MKFSRIDDLCAFIDGCENKLLKDKENRRLVEYPDPDLGLRNSDEIARKNKPLFDDISSTANIYAIFAASTDDSNFTPVYVGQRESGNVASRLKNHLTGNSLQTYSKWDNVMKHVQKGGKIRVSWISVEPELLRLCVEAELIHRNKKDLAWNVHGTK